MHSRPTRVFFNNIGSICTDSLRHGNGLCALLLLTRAAKSSAAKSSAAKTRSMESRLYMLIIKHAYKCMKSAAESRNVILHSRIVRSDSLFTSPLWRHWIKLL